MSLFQALSDMSKQHAENSGESGQYHYGSILDNGKIDVVFPPAEPEPAPTISLYNLLDHSRDDLDILHGIVRSFTREKIEPIKESVPAHYTSAIAWIRILETAMKERERRDSEGN